MKKLFLSSQISVVAKHIVSKLPSSPNRLRTAFITTAAEAEPGEKEWQVADRQSMVEAGLDVFDYTITGKNYQQLVEDLKEVDIIHINGGNQFYLLLQAKRSGFDRFIKEYVEDGKIYFGSSAGSMVAAPDIAISRVPGGTDFAAELGNFQSFGLVDVLILPRWGKASSRAEYRKKRVIDAFKPENKIILLNDFQYVYVEDEMYRIFDVRD